MTQNTAVKDYKVMFRAYPFLGEIFALIAEINSLVDHIENQDQVFKAMVTVSYMTIMDKIDAEIEKLQKEGGTRELDIKILNELKQRCIIYSVKINTPSFDIRSVNREMQELLMQEAKKKAEEASRDTKKHQDINQLQLEIKKVLDAPSELRYLGWLTGTKMSQNIQDFPIDDLKNFLHSFLLYNEQVDEKLPKAIHEGLAFLKIILEQIGAIVKDPNLMLLEKESALTKKIEQFLKQAKFMFAKVDGFRAQIVSCINSNEVKHEHGPKKS